MEWFFVLALARPAQLFFVRSSQFERARALRNRGSKMRLIVDALIMIALGLFAWLVAFLGFAVLYAGPHGPRPKTLAVVAIVPAILVTVLDVAIVAYRRCSQLISEK
jgi:hypothetical protein